MVAQMQTQPMEVTRPNVVAWVQAYIDGGMDPTAAFRQVYEDMERLDQLLDLAKLHGPNLVGMIWRGRNAAIRRPDTAVTFRPDTQTIDVDRQMGTVARTPTAPPPAPVIPIPEREVVNSLDGMQKIGSEWVMVRYLTKAQCRMLADINKQKAGPFLHNKAYFLALEAALENDTQTVGEKLTEQQLARLYRMTKP